MSAQTEKQNPSGKQLTVNLGERSYTITVGKNLLGKANELFRLDRKVFILTDEGVPKEYAEKVCACCGEGRIFTVPQGEGSKSMAVLEQVLTEMMHFDMTRKDALISVGGGVVGDLGGFAAAAYMRGIDFYQIPTTVLAQVDSSIGGKCAVNLGGTKNIVGTFYQPKGVLIDMDTLTTLPGRLVSAGLAESVKMALTSDQELFCLFEDHDFRRDQITDSSENPSMNPSMNPSEGPAEKLTENPSANPSMNPTEDVVRNRNDLMEEIILRSLQIKKAVVEQDEKESGIRKILNFGHTLGHGIEAETEMKGLFHGECVALGMLPMCSDKVRSRLLPVLEKIGLPTTYEYDREKALSYVIHDKKCSGGSLDVITVEEIGSCEICRVSIKEFRNLVRRSL